MQAMILPFFARRPDIDKRLPEDRLRDRVSDELRGRVDDTTISQARARAIRMLIGGRPFDYAARHAVNWALNTLPELPPAA